MKPGTRALLSLSLAVATTSALSLAQPDSDVAAGSDPAQAATADALPTASASAAEPLPSAQRAPTATPSAPLPPAAPPSAAPPPAAPPSAAPAPLAPVATQPSAPGPAAPRWTWAKQSPLAREDQGSTAEPQDEHPPRVAWKGTSLIASNEVTTSLVGVGADYQSSSYQVYSQGYALLLNYFLYDEEGTSLRVAVTPGFDVELTNSNDTDKKHEMVFRDLPIAVAAGTPLYAQKGSLYRTSAGLNLTTFVATSKYTRGAGDIATLSPRLSLAQSLPLAGKSASVFRSFQVGLGLRYDHLFSRADVQVADQLTRSGSSSTGLLAATDTASVSRLHTARALQDGSGNTAYSDVLSGVRQAPNSVRATAFVVFSEEFGIPVQLALGATYGEAYLAPAADSEVSIATGPVELPSDAGRAARRTAGVSAGLTLFPLSELGVALGYENGADLDGPSPNLLYTPRAVFTASLVVGLDALYERATGPARSEPFMLF